MTQSFQSPRSLGILLVEDETVAAIDFECIAEDLGHRVVAVAVTPVQARRVMRDLGHRIDLVVFGARLIGLSSLEFAGSLARSNRAAVVTSNIAEADLRSEGFEEPCLAKPFDSAEVTRLLRVVEHVVQRAA
ncbi:MAG: hypothetical protein HKN18_06130 [Silicimonas sp.]|nr:hypothetical protein [Silicimonas sp.]